MDEEISQDELAVTPSTYFGANPGDNATIDESTETVSLISLREDAPALTFAPGGLDAVTGLLDRAAMPGQPATEAGRG